MKDLGRGAKRTARGLQFWDGDAMIKIATENEAAWRLFKRLVKGGVRGATAVLSNLLEITVGLLTTWAHLPAELKNLAVDKLGAAARTVVENVVAKEVGKWAVRRVVRELAERVVKTGAYRILAKKLGVSAAFSGTWVGIPIAMLGVQGLFEKAAAASDRLRSRFPGLHRQLARTDLHMAWFLVEPFVDELRGKLAARLKTMLSGAREGRILVDSGDGRTPIRAGGGDDRVPIRTGGSSRERRVPIRTGGG